MYLKSLYRVIICNLTHLQDRKTKGKIYVKNIRKNSCRIRNQVKSRIRIRPEPKKIFPDPQHCHAVFYYSPQLKFFCVCYSNAAFYWSRKNKREGRNLGILYSLILSG